MAVNLGKELSVVLFMNHVRKSWNDVSESKLLRAIQKEELEMSYAPHLRQDEDLPNENYLLALRLLLAELRVENSRR